MRAGSPRRRATGFTLIAALALLAIVSLGLAIAGPAWADRARRDREQELLRIGALYAVAIAEYRDRSPGGSRNYPDDLTALLIDPRYPGLVRHLRQLYPDPLDPRRPWGLVRDAGGHIIGVFSDSTEVPLTRVTVQAGPIALAPAATYAQWKFIAPPPL